MIQKETKQIWKKKLEKELKQKNKVHHNFFSSVAKVVATLSGDLIIIASSLQKKLPSQKK
jgi:hypothetical protein